MSVGDVYHGTFKLSETSDIPATVKIYTSPYSVTTESYDPLFEHNESYRNSIKDWVTFPEGTDFTVPANSEIDIPFTVTIPEGALGGSQYCAIITELVLDNGEPSDDGTSIAISSLGRIALPIFADIQGDEVNIEGNLIDWKSPSVYFDIPVKANFTIENTGNVVFDASYKIEISEAFRSDDSNVFVEEDTKRIYPGTKRVVYHEWSTAPYLGMFNLKETISYLGETKEFSRFVIIVPLWLVIILLSILVLVIIAIVRRILKSRRKILPHRVAETSSTWS